MLCKGSSSSSSKLHTKEKHVMHMKAKRILWLLLDSKFICSDEKDSQGIFFGISRLCIHTKDGFKLENAVTYMFMFAITKTLNVIMLSVNQTNLNGVHEIPKLLIGNTKHV